MINSNEFNWENIAIGAAKYDFIMAKFSKTDVSKDEEFQKRFTGFYRIRRSKELFLEKYYAYMESLKGKKGQEAEKKISSPRWRPQLR